MFRFSTAGLIQAGEDVVRPADLRGVESTRNESSGDRRRHTLICNVYEIPTSSPEALAAQSSAKI